MSTLIFIDLDDTLFQTSAKHPSGSTRITATHDHHGKPNSFMTPAQQQFLEFLTQDTAIAPIVIPTTGRTTHAFARVVPSVRAGFCNHRILEHGALILNPDNQPDTAWLSRTADAVVAHRAALESAHVALQAIAATITLDFGLECTQRLHMLEHPALPAPVGPIYSLLKANKLDVVALAALHTALPALDAQYPELAVFAQGRAVTIMPKLLSKAAAVKHLIAQLKPRLTIGVGDARSDADFLACCDYAMVPQRSQLQALWSGCSRVAL
jgi:hydroxymethylpyrimidine pyrophosphatase-like HAD family hydrolase